MRLIRRLLVLGIVGVAGYAAYTYWSDGSLLSKPTTALAAAAAKREAADLASKAADTATEAASAAAGKLGDTFGDGALTAKIKSKMALDDHVKARSINVDTADGVATLTGVVASRDERNRALQLARDTEGIKKVVDKLEIER